MGEALCEIDFPDIPLSCSWNWDGSRFAVACKDHKIRIVEPRTGKFIRVSHSMSLIVSDTELHCLPKTTRNSSGDEIANVNFLYDDIVHALQNTIDWCINSTTDSGAGSGMAGMAAAIPIC